MNVFPIASEAATVHLVLLSFKRKVHIRHNYMIYYNLNNCIYYTIHGLDHVLRYMNTVVGNAQYTRIRINHASAIGSRSSRPQLLPLSL